MSYSSMIPFDSTADGQERDDHAGECAHCQERATATCDECGARICRAHGGDIDTCDRCFDAAIERRRDADDAERNRLEWEQCERWEMEQQQFNRVA